MQNRSFSLLNVIAVRSLSLIVLYKSVFFFYVEKKRRKCKLFHCCRLCESAERLLAATHNGSSCLCLWKGIFLLIDHINLRRAATVRRRSIVIAIHAALLEKIQTTCCSVIWRTLSVAFDTAAVGSLIVSITFLL
ncbi:secretin receptor [Trichinella spiralis]|uniref:secretin receptor n=1 Tax=Trichinella spiralis TaxID=6334 RepID=UPI0001EFC841|nr:secretin receptor [Trichinella spiralis]